MFTAVLFAMAKIWIQPQCPSADWPLDKEDVVQQLQSCSRNSCAPASAAQMDFQKCNPAASIATAHIGGEPRRGAAQVPQARGYCRS